MTRNGKLGVVVVTYNAAAVIAECVESLFASGEELAVAVVDNDSSDGTVEAIEAWARGDRPFVPDPRCPVALGPVAKPIRLHVAQAGDAEEPDAPLTILRSPVNGGFARGVNLGIERLARRADVQAFWILNPDCVAAPETPRLLAEASRDREFGILGGRCLYYERPDTIQTDGGVVNRATGVCSSVHAGAPAATTPFPDPATLDFVSGAHLVASRAFVREVGPMPEDYFLYYEEVAWAFGRGRFPLEIAPGAIVYHHGGASIGSGTRYRRAAPFSEYFNHRNRLRFVRAFFPKSLPAAALWSVAKAGQHLLAKAPRQAAAVIAGAFQLKPPREVEQRIADPKARALAFAKPKP